LFKHSSPDTVFHAIVSAARGEFSAFRLIPFTAARHLDFIENTMMNLQNTRDRNNELAPDGCPLSKREREVLQWVSAGKTSWETARVLGIAENTVNNHVKAIKAKLGIVNRVQAVAYAERAGWLKTP
jgi:DNA-binding CsgD family transcriptional regulator